MKRVICAVVVAVLVGQVGLLAVDSKKAQYIGGTIAGLKEKAEAPFVTTDEVVLKFDAKKNGTLDIPYASISELEYGQKAGRRVAMGILISPLALFSKKRSHYLTITFTDAAGKEQAAVFEIGKDAIRTTLKVLETRSGKEIQYQDEEARKSGLGGK
jgi:hypothetical protein